MKLLCVADSLHGRRRASRSIRVSDEPKRGQRHFQRAKQRQARPPALTTAMSATWVVAIEIGIGANHFAVTFPNQRIVLSPSNIIVAKKVLYNFRIEFFLVNRLRSSTQIVFDDLR